MVKRLTNKEIRDKLRTRKCAGGRCEIRLSVKRARLVEQAIRLKEITRQQADGESKQEKARKRIVAFVELVNRFIVRFARSKKTQPPSDNAKKKLIKAMMTKLDKKKTYRISSNRAFKYIRKHFWSMYPKRAQDLADKYRNTKP